MIRLSRIPIPILVMLTAVTLPFSAYLHLAVDKKGVVGIEFKDMMNAWPVFLLIAAVLVLLLSIFVSLLFSSMSRRLAWFGIGLAWTYYALSFISLCLLTSVVMFMTSWTYQFFAPLLFLAAATYRLRQEQKAVMPA